MYFTCTLFSLNDITTDLFIKEFLLVTRLPVIAGLAMLDTIDIAALLHVSTALT